MNQSTSASTVSQRIAEAFPRSRPDTRAALASAANVRSFAARHIIGRQGDDQHVALVLEGYVALQRTTSDGRELIVRIVRRPGLTQVLPLAGRAAPGDSLALSPSLAAIWQGSEVRALASVDAGLAGDLLDHALVWFEETMGRLDGLGYQNAGRRVAAVLEEHAALFFAEQPVLHRSDLPGLVGTSREMTGRVLRILEARRVVERIGRNRLRLVDAAGLAAAAHVGLRGVGATTELVPRQGSSNDATVRESPGRTGRGPSGDASGDAS
jgi:CRP-like cAMP-binding protein